jgi:hypothetical protein
LIQTTAERPTDQNEYYYKSKGRRDVGRPGQRWTDEHFIRRYPCMTMRRIRKKRKRKISKERKRKQEPSKVDSREQSSTL